jgi:UDP-N-acetyl-D-glucosamine dehydrogenase
LGIAYKQDVSDYRESPAIRVIDILESRGAKVSFYDPYITEYKEKNHIKIGLKEIDNSNLKSFDLVIITTGHTKFDYISLQKNSKFIFDTKNAMKNILERNNIQLL